MCLAYLAYYHSSLWPGPRWSPIIQPVRILCDVLQLCSTHPFPNPCSS
ncbi:hypothetical protein CGCVW01_v005000 [Colletotrichum viniferum]|nr:hypothetical protein CGCVW01_v005000 [Colletotrichum viniferum]